MQELVWKWRVSSFSSFIKNLITNKIAIPLGLLERNLILLRVNFPIGESYDKKNL